MSIIISLPRSFIIKLISFVDLLFPPSFGAVQTKVVRKISEFDISTNVNTSNPDIDIRTLIWKREALDILIDIVQKKKISDIKLMEIGSANGMVSLMLAKWAEKHQIPYKGICVEPNFSNIDFLQQMITKNNHNIKIVPCVINGKERWTAFEDVGNKGLVGEAIKTDSPTKNKDNIIYKYSISIDEFMSSSFEPNIIYIDALLNESLILDQLIKHCTSHTYILVEFDRGVSENLKKNIYDNNFEILHVNNFHFIISKKL